METQTGESGAAQPEVSEDAVVVNTPDSPTVEVNVIVEQPSETAATETPQEIVAVEPGAGEGEEIAALDTTPETVVDAANAGTDDDSTAPTELESLEVERTEVEIEHARLENERMEIENEALRDQVEHAAEDSVQEVGVTADGRDAQASSDKGKGEAERGEAATSATGGSATASGEGDGGSSRPKSESSSSSGSSGRQPRTRRFKRGT